jgi:glycogen(starch) synthase
MNRNLPVTGPRHNRCCRVLMTADTIGGVWTYAVELARGLAEQQVEIALATMGAPLEDGQRRDIAALGNVELFESRYRLEWMQAWDEVRAAGDWLLEVAARVQPDVIHLNNYVHATLPWPAPKMVVAHSDVLSWWRAVKGEDAPPEWDEYRRAVTGGLRRADVVVAPTRSALGDIARHYGPMRRMELIPNGRDLAFLPTPKEKYVFSSGRLWDEAKNMATLANVAGELPWPVRVAGDAQEPGGRRATFRNVELLGRLDAALMAEHFRRAAIYCLPARYEPFGLSVLEAALSGCALVLGDIPSLRELWDGAAVFVCPSNARALRSAIEDLINDERKWRELANRARARSQRFTTPQMVASYHSLYTELAGTAAPATESLLCAS